MASFDLVRCPLSAVRDLVERHHGYGSMGNTATYAFAVREGDRVVAAYAWQPPAPGAARSVCPEEPGGVLALSRMVAVPRAERALAHVSKPLRAQAKTLIDRGRWPVLITYSDEGQGHTGYVYACAGWTKTLRSRAQVWLDSEGRRVSPYSAGRRNVAGLTRGPDTWIQRWESWACRVGEVSAHMRAAGWIREPIPGRTWRSGSPAMRWVKR